MRPVALAVNECSNDEKLTERFRHSSLVIRLPPKPRHFSRSSLPAGAATGLPGKTTRKFKKA
jgi:hypothetical protein